MKILKKSAVEVILPPWDQKHTFITATEVRKQGEDVAQRINVLNPLMVLMVLMAKTDNPLYIMKQIHKIYEMPNVIQ